MDQVSLYSLIGAADYLQIESLLHLASAYLAAQTAGLSAAKIRDVFSVPDDIPLGMQALWKEENLVKKGFQHRTFLLCRSRFLIILGRKHHAKKTIIILT
mmetsp:Transcript_35097/g.77349  ORF Transcript_35097/g.77349 Transcript_35097/m.77349 type:complete len:100 (+) Transcript_35097:821-1120(+)